MHVLVLSTAMIVLLFNSSAMATCLQNPDVSRQYWYPDGDSWCAAHGAGQVYAYTLTLITLSIKPRPRLFA